MTTSSELDEWELFFKEDASEFHPIHNYLAQIAQEIRRSYVTAPDSVTREQFLIPFFKAPPAALKPTDDEQQEDEEEEQITPEEEQRLRKEWSDRAKSRWGARLGKPQPPPPSRKARR